MKTLLAILLGLSVLLTLTASAESEEEDVVREIAYTTETGESGYLYASDDVPNHPEAKVPAVLMMMCTGGDARENARACGWVDKAAEERMLVIAPEYNNYAT